MKTLLSILTLFVISGVDLPPAAADDFAQLRQMTDRNGEPIRLGPSPGGYHLQGVYHLENGESIVLPGDIEAGNFNWSSFDTRLVKDDLLAIAAFNAGKGVPAKLASFNAAGGGFFQRAKFRAFLNLKALRSTDQKTRQAIRKVLSDRDLFESAYDGVSDEYSQQAGGPVTDLLDWLMANSDKVIAFLMQLVELFSQMEAMLAPQAVFQNASMFTAIHEHQRTACNGAGRVHGRLRGRLHGLRGRLHRVLHRGC